MLLETWEDYLESALSDTHTHTSWISFGNHQNGERRRDFTYGKVGGEVRLA